MTIPAYPASQLLKDDPWISQIEHLADPFFGSDSCVDLLIGTKTIGEITHESILKHPREPYAAIKTLFGWAIYGGGTNTPSSGIVLRTDAKPTLDELLTQLWERDEIPENMAETHYKDTFYCLSDGSNAVRLSRKDPAPNLGDSRNFALKQLQSTEGTLKKQSKLDKFSNVMQEYLDLGHSEEIAVPKLNLPPFQHYYMPVHAIAKATSTTTKLRAVFNALAKTTLGSSLNDQLLPTPSLFPLISTIVNRFRMHTIALTANVAKMYREITLDLSEYDFHRYLTRGSDGNVKEFLLLE